MLHDILYITKKDNQEYRYVNSFQELSPGVINWINKCLKTS